MLRLLRDARLPEADIVPGASWDYGVDLDWLKDLRRCWLEEWSWDEAVASLSAFKHYTVEIEGVKVHYIHAPSPRSDAIPIILTHGWPGSVFEFLKVIAPLSNPSSDGDPAFHVVVPSLPGYGFSGPQPRKGWTLIDTARLFNTLMTDVLDYYQYVAQGGDWGYLVTRMLCTNHSQHCTLAHFNNFAVYPPPIQYPALALMAILPTWISSYLSSYLMVGFEMQKLQDGQQVQKTGLGYLKLQSTKPSTVGYALYDSPLGLLAYIGEKYHEWTDNERGPPKKDIIDTVAFYFLARTFHTSLMPYYESAEIITSLKYKQPKTGKAGISYSKHDIMIVPSSWAKSVVNLVFYHQHSNGGHFMALENPDGLVDDLREFVRDWWKA